MRVLRLLLSKRYHIAFLILAGASLVATGVALSSISTKTGKQDKALSRSEIRRILNAQLKDGLGKEISLDRSSDKTIKESVDSTTDFIQSRSGLELSDRSKQRLNSLEQRSAKGKGRLLTTDDLAEAITDTGLERLSNSTDQEIEQAAVTLNREGDGVNLRANG